MSKFVEEWRDVVGYEGIYQVSDWGNVKSVDRTYEYFIPKFNKTIRRAFKGVQLKKVLNEDGYHIVTFSDSNHQQSQAKVHRLVAEAFLPNPENKPEVGHTKTLENGLEDKTANEAWNIAWMTREENGTYGTICQRLSESKMGDKNPMYGKTKKINQYNLITDEFIRTWDSATDVERELKIWRQNVSKCCNEKCNSAGGFKWRYANE